MKIKLLKYLTPLIVIFGVFLLPRLANASPIYQQTDSSTSQTLGGTPYFAQSLGSGLSGSVGSVTVSVSSSYVGQTVTAVLAKRWNSDCTSARGDIVAETAGHTDISATVSGTKTSYTFSFANYRDSFVGGSHYTGPYTLDSSVFYCIVLYKGTSQNLTVYGSATNAYSGGACYNIGVGACANPPYDIYFDVDGSFVLPPANMTIDSPASASFLSTASSTTISGKCLNIGSNQLELTTTPFLARLDPNSSFNITCSSSYTYSTTFTPKTGSNTVWIIDKSVQGENPPNIFNNQRYASVQYTGYSGSTLSLAWFLSLEYPADNGSHSFTINPNTTQQFRFRYKVPDDGVKATSSIRTILWTNSSRSVASTTNEFYDLNTLDLDGDGLLGLNVGPVPDGQTWYYTEYLKYQGQVMYDIPFSVTASSTAQSAGTTVNPNAPDDRQYGPCLNLPLIGLNNFCFGTLFYALVIPNPRFYKDDVNDTYSLMQTKIPFAFYYQLKDQLSGVSASSTDFTYNIPVTLATSTGVNLNIPFSSNNSGVHSVRSALDPWFKSFAWFFFAWWAYKKAINFKF